LGDATERGLIEGEGCGAKITRHGDGALFAEDIFRTQFCLGRSVATFDRTGVRVMRANLENVSRILQDYDI
jgi:hypothetical protein